MNPSVHIRHANLNDMTGIHALVRELAIYEKAPEQHTASIHDYERDFSAGVFDSYVAVSDHNQIIGMILYYTAYSTWRGKMLYLEDFVVTEQCRKFGVGQLLFDKFIQIAKESNARLIKWQVLDWNEPAIQFYKKNQATIEDEWYNGKIFLKNNVLT